MDYLILNQEDEFLDVCIDGVSSGGRSTANMHSDTLQVLIHLIHLPDLHFLKVPKLLS